MSDVRRRRRKSDQSLASDVSDGFDELNVTKETLSSEQTEEHHDSEYDTADSDAESDGGSQDGTQRESGDGQEEEDKASKKLDDDEDRRNPQYIPKRGTFYEHDDRTTEEIAEAVEEPPVERESKEKGKVWKDRNDRWDHDRYNDEEQAPKSHEELIAVYGYDIRNEEGPPRARRRRRYGRGPNKYTRNWEDENAYGKPVSNVSKKKVNRRSKKNGEEFPALNKNAPETVEEPVISSAWYSNKSKTYNKEHNFPPLQNQQDNQMMIKTEVNNIHTNENKAPNESITPPWKKDMKFNNSTTMNKNNSVDTIKSIQPKAIYGNKKNVQESVSLAASRSRGRGYKPNSSSNMLSRSPELGPKGRGIGSTINSGEIRKNINQHDEEQLINDMKQINFNDNYHHSERQQSSFYNQSSSQQRPKTSPSQMLITNSHQSQTQPQQQSPQQPQSQQQNHPQSADAAGNRPKRYSSLRQRPAITESPAPAQQTYSTQHNQHTFYPQGGNSHNVIESQGFAQGHFEQTTAVPSSAAPLPAPPVIPMSTTGQPPTYAPPPFLVPTPQFMPPQTAPPSIINYVPAPNGPTFQPNFQGYQGYSPTPQGPPPPELYQPPQGCTYYNPAQQPQQQQQVAPVRRLKAAIPILPPPENSLQQQQQQQLQQLQHYQSKGQSRKSSQMNGSDIQSPVEIDKFIPPDVQTPAADEMEIPVQYPDISDKIEHVLDETVHDELAVESNTEVYSQDKTEQVSEIIERHVELENLPESTKEVSNADPMVIINSDILVAKDVQIEAKPIIDNDLSKVESVVHENKMVEEATA